MPRLTDTVLTSIFNTWVYSRLIGGASLLGVELQEDGGQTQFCKIASMSAYIPPGSSLDPADFATLLSMRDDFFKERLRLSRASHYSCLNSDSTFFKDED